MSEITHVEELKGEDCTVTPLIKERNKKIDIIKGLAILLMVFGHAIFGSVGAGYDYLYEWIYLFHMPVFFMASGFFWKDTSVKNLKQLLVFIWKKTKSLYIPYVFLNLFFLFFDDVLVALNLCETGINPLDLSVGNIIKILLLYKGSVGFAGATWFLRALYIVLVAQGIWVFILNKIKAPKFISFIPFFGVVLFLLIIAFIQKDIPDVLFQILPAYIYFVFGILIKNVKKLTNLNVIYAVILSIISTGLLVAIVFLRRRNAIISDILDVGINGILGWIMLYSISVLIEKYSKIITRILCYLEKTTIYIVLWHFIAFKPVSLVYILIKRLPIEKLKDLPVIQGTSSVLLAFSYTLVSVAICLLIRIIYVFFINKIKELFRKNKHNKSL
ncbi:MAG: hypothetical protein E7355_02940 [Clostridiales bacterium]|nr:hypothetical protein [Clostridiales bacterium]